MYDLLAENLPTLLMFTAPALVAAAVILIVMTIERKRRGKFNRRR